MMSCINDVPNFFLLLDLLKYKISHTKVIIDPIMISQVAFESLIITADVKTFSFLTSHITTIHAHRHTIGENHSHINNNPNKAKSTNAVIFAKAANQNIIHAMMTYFSKSFLSSEFSLFCKKMSPANSASKDSAITHKSVLLSTITRKAHIQLVSQSNNMLHPLIIHHLLLNSDCTISSFHFFISAF